jgi:hypothetical protein
MERVLRRYSRISEKTRECTQCRREIYPGYFYDGFVVAIGRGVLRVDVYHLDPPCHHDEPGYELEDELSETSNELLAA